MVKSAENCYKLGSCLSLWCITPTSFEFIKRVCYGSVHRCQKRNSPNLLDPILVKSTSTAFIKI